MNNILKGYRVMAKLTQEEMAGELNMTRLNYMLKENGQGRFSLEQRKKVLEILKKRIPNVKLEDLFPID